MGVRGGMLSGYTSYSFHIQTCEYTHTHMHNPLKLPCVVWEAEVKVWQRLYSPLGFSEKYTVPWTIRQSAALLPWLTQRQESVSERWLLQKVLFKKNSLVQKAKFKPLFLGGKTWADKWELAQDSKIFPSRKCNEWVSNHSHTMKSCPYRISLNKQLPRWCKSVWSWTIGRAKG